MFCSNCGAQNSENSKYCASCGAKLAPQDVVSEDHQAVEFWETAVGPKRTDYYIQKFRKFSDGHGWISWNWPAFFVSFLWLLYRKMWLYAALYFFAPSVIFFSFLGIAFALGAGDNSAIVATVTQLAATFVLFPMIANALYYRIVSKRVAAARSYSEGRERQLRVLASEGGTSNAALVLIVFLIVPIAGILAAIAIPAYQDYTIRAQVSEGLNLAAAAKAAVAESILDAGGVPRDRAAAGMTFNPLDSSGKYVRSVDVVLGRIKITYGGEANSLIAGETLSLIPYLVDRGSEGYFIVWQCGTGPVPSEATHELTDYDPGTLAVEKAQFLPTACRP